MRGCGGTFFKSSPASSSPSSLHRNDRSQPDIGTGGADHELEVTGLDDPLHFLIEELEGILADPAKILEIIKNEMLEIKQKYGDERRTDIEISTEEIDLEDLIEKHHCVITLTNAGYIKRLPADTYSAQHRGGKGITGMTTRDEDFIEKVSSVHSHSTVMFFTNRGRVQTMRAFKIPEASRTAKGTNIVNLLELAQGEKVTSFISVDDFSSDMYLTMVTKYGVVKKTHLSEYEYQRKGGKIALSLDEGDELLYVAKTRGDDEIIIATKQGNAVRFDECGVRPMGRTARGVRGIALKDDDYVVGVVIVDDNKKLLTITENGFGKKTEFEDFRLMKHRGGFGVICHNINEKTGLLAGILSVDDNDDIMMITDGGIVIRTPAADISTYSRSAAGVITMRLDEGSKIANITKVAREDEIEKDDLNNDTENTKEPEVITEEAIDATDGGDAE